MFTVFKTNTSSMLNYACSLNRVGLLSQECMLQQFCVSSSKLMPPF